MLDCSRILFLWQQTFSSISASPILILAVSHAMLSATHVPVGDDQTQHLELARDIAERFNRTYPRPSPIFTLPKTIKSWSPYFRQLH